MSAYSVTILANVEDCRTEAEVTCAGQLVAVVYQESAGWHTKITENKLTQPPSDFDAAVTAAQQALSHYVNRLGANPPRNMTRGAFSLWLMTKDDGTALGIPVQDDIKS